MFTRKGYSKIDDNDDDLCKIYTDDDDEDDIDDELDLPDDAQVHISVFGFVMLILSVIIIVVGALLYIMIRGQYEQTYSVDYTNSKYIEMADSIGGDDTYIVSALGYDIALNDIADEKDFDYTQRVALAHQTGRNFKSLNVSNSILSRYSSAEDIEVFDSVSNKELSDLLGVEYKLSPAFEDVDKIVVYDLPSEFSLESCMYEENLYLTGTYYKSGAAFKVPMSDGKHDMIWYRDDLPSYDEDWAEITGTLCVPSESFVCTSSANQTVEGLLAQDICKIVQILQLKVISENNSGKFIQYSNRVGIPYHLAIINSDTGVVVASGTFDE